MRKVLRPLTSISATCLLLLLSHGALASNESLTFRRATNGHIEAVVSGLDDGPGCLLLEFTAPLPVTITGNTIVITSSFIPTSCTIPLFPLVPYQVVADLGILALGIYQVTWTQGPIALSAQLVPAALAPEVIPTTSGTALIPMSLLISFIAARSLARRSTGRPPAGLRPRVGRRLACCVRRHR
jgi:hypothetical protein